MNPLLKQREVVHYVRDSGMVLLLAHHSADDEARAGAEGSGTLSCRRCQRAWQTC
ncbi:hypothetical protein ABT124_45360 [Streptomyces sp. NPDC001982]|uniref:hypothetical protein n=1 Tax=unclassified Streptomyces TaxID=2593676 RepID=UPI0033210ADB